MGEKSVTDVPEVWGDILSLLSSLGHENLTPESTAKSLGIDSLDSLEILMKLEQTFDIHLEDDFMGPEETLLALAYKLSERMKWQESSPIQ